MDIVRAATWVAVRQRIPAEAVQQQASGRNLFRRQVGRI
jgi:hypothetical protein